MLILGLDPGQTTGYVVTETETNTADEVGAIVECGTMEDWREIERLLQTHTPNIMVIEKYLLYPALAKAQSFSPMLTSQVIGVAKFLAEKFCVPCIEQKAATGKAVILSEDLYRELHNDHIRDAARHIRAYLLSKGMR